MKRRRTSTRPERRSHLQKQTPAEFLGEWLPNLRITFYQWKDKAFYQQRDQLIQALAYPAEFLSERGVFLPSYRFNEIMREIVDGVKLHGAEKIKHFGVYFLQVVQSHVKNRAESYYEEGKTAAALATSDMGLTQIFDGIQPDETGDQPHTFTEALATMAKLTRSGPKKGHKQAKEAKKETAQTELF